MKNMHRNNFDLIRLFAAGQVALLHIVKNMEIPLPHSLQVVRAALELFPGVPIFFVTSGYLISASFQRNPNLGSYCLARILRIYPALWVATAVSVASACFFIAGANGPLTHTVSVLDLVRWIVAQLSIAQFYAPFSVRETFGVGHPNGSLWTIPVELQFYLLLPFLFGLFRPNRSRLATRGLFALIVVSYGCSVAYLLMKEPIAAWNPDISLLLRVTLLPYLYMFALGIGIQVCERWRSRLLDGKALFWLFAYVVVVLMEKVVLGAPVGTNTPDLLSMALLAAAVVSAAFTRPMWSARILHGNDVSYGLYVYHMIVVNIAVSLGVAATLETGALVFVAAGLCAIASWFLVERPAIRLKRRARSMNAASLPVGAGAI